MYRVFFAPTLQPVTQLPQLMHGFCVHAIRVRAVNGEIDDDIERLNRGPDFHRPPIERLYLGQRERVRMGIGRQHRLCARGSKAAAPVLDGRGPVKLLEDFLVGDDGDVGIDQRGAAQTGAFDHGDIRVIQQLIQTRAGSGRCAAPPRHPSGASGYSPGCHSLPRSIMQIEGFGFRSAVASRAAVMAPP